MYRAGYVTGGSMPKHLMIAIDWFGPYRDLSAARKIADKDYADGLYVCIGKLPNQHRTRIQYIGISKRLAGRISEDHYQLKKVTRDRQLWMGEIATSEPSGKKLKVTKRTLDFAEWLHARFMQLPLNERKTKGLPSRSVTIMNRWWKTDYITIRKNRPHPDWPDLIDFPDYGIPARMIWFGGKRRFFSAPEYANP